MKRFHSELRATRCLRSNEEAVNGSLAVCEVAMDARLLNISEGDLGPVEVVVVEFLDDGRGAFMRGFRQRNRILGI